MPLAVEGKVEPQGRVSSKKSRRRQKKAAAAAVAAAAASAAVQNPAPVPSAFQRLYNTCKDVFAGCKPGVVPSPDKVARLSDFLANLKPEDVDVSPNLPHFQHADSQGPPGVTYLHFFDCSGFSFGVFCLPESAVIPLHNHPGMTVFSKILFGSMHIKSYDWVKTPQGSDEIVRSTDGARLANVKTDTVFESPCETLVLYPENGGNLHCFTAVTSCAVLDVMGPPYSRADGRDCSYYEEFPYSSFSGGKEMPDGDERYAWLKEVPCNFELKAVHNAPKIVQR